MRRSFLLTNGKFVSQMEGMYQLCLYPSVISSFLLSQDALAKTIDLLVDEGDPVLVEDPTYSGALSVFRPYNCNIIGVKTDQDGLVPDALRHVLQNWKSGLRRPRVLYTIPTGQNPSGTTLPNARRRAVYDIAAEHDLLIIEDDPYWNLRFDGEADLRSLWSLDTEGRVIRLDSFSKIVSSGFRLGWVSGPKTLVERIQLDQQVKRQMESLCISSSFLSEFR
jgi:kynurenine/2-aminoadipate aminotransferase